MRGELFTSAGFYYSCYLRIRINTDDSFLSYCDLSDLGAAIFLHEYIHFLQDITTTHGLFNIAGEVDYIKLFNSKLQSNGTEPFKVPFTTSLKDGNVHVNNEMRKIWIGAGEHKNFTGDYEIISEIQPLQIGLDTWPMVREYIRVGNETNGFKYYFGSYCISEGMAYEIEQVIYPNVILPLPPSLPYSAPRLVAEKLHPGFNDNIENLVALCDASLMYSDPGQVFCYILRHMQRTGYYPPSPEDVYAYVYSKMRFNYVGITSVSHLFYYAGHLANSQLSDYFRSNIFKQNNIWIAHTLSGAASLRVDTPSFVLDLMRGGDIRSNNVFQAIKGALGTPIIVNNNSEMFFENILNGYGYQIEPQYFWVFSEIRDLITKKWEQLGRTHLCGLKEFCERSNEGNPFTDYRCHNGPWERASDENQNLCAFAATWKAWGLEGKSIIN